MFQDGRRFSILFLTGAVILVVGLILQWYPTSVIGGMQQRLQLTGLTAEERYALNNNVAWWEIQQITIFQPLSAILFAVGIIIIVYAVIHGVFSTFATYKIIKKEQT